MVNDTNMDIPLYYYHSASWKNKFFTQSLSQANHLIFLETSIIHFRNKIFLLHLMCYRNVLLPLQRISGNNSKNARNKI